MEGEIYEEYILISSSAVYPEHSKLPFKEDMKWGVNKYWGKYGQMNNIYRESFVFDCALLEKNFTCLKMGR